MGEMVDTVGLACRRLAEATQIPFTFDQNQKQTFDQSKKPRFLDAADAAFASGKGKRHLFSTGPTLNFLCQRHVMSGEQCQSTNAVECLRHTHTKAALMLCVGAAAASPLTKTSLEHAI